MTEFLTTAEVAAHLRLKERTVYELLRTRRIPATRVTGRWLFPRHLVDAWALAGVEMTGGGLAPAPPVIAGSEDPLLDWTVRESRCELAQLPGGSADGLRLLAAGKAVAAGLHILDGATGLYNVPAVQALSGVHDLVLIEWAWRRQGLVLASGNPLGIGGLQDMADRRLRLAVRQEEAGAQILLRHLLATAGLELRDLAVVTPVCRTETDLANMVLDGKADGGLAVEAVARRARLGFLPLQDERFDLALRRRDYFEPPVQALLAFARTSAVATRAAELGGYRVDGLGRVIHNT